MAEMATSSPHGLGSDFGASVCHRFMGLSSGALSRACDGRITRDVPSVNHPIQIQHSVAGA